MDFFTVLKLSRIILVTNCIYVEDVFSKLIIGINVKNKSRKKIYQDRLNDLLLTFQLTLILYFYIYIQGLITRISSVDIGNEIEKFKAMENSISFLLCNKITIKCLSKHIIYLYITM